MDHKPIIGLPNFGNTCYINTLFQCLFNCAGFKFRKPKSEFGSAFYSIKKRYEKGTLTAEQFHGFFLVLKAELKNLMDLDDQNDMQEMYLAFVNKLLELEGRPADEQLVLAQGLLKSSFDREDIFFAHCEVAWWRDHVKAWCSMAPIFNGQVVSQIKCSLCNYIVQNPELFCNIDVDIETGVSLPDLIGEFYALHPVNEWKCDKCGNVSCGGRVLKITRTPRILVITLKRFDAQGNKKRDLINIPHKLTLPYETHVFDKPLKFTLSAIGCHQGNQYGGHYYAAVADESSWTVVNDESVELNAARRVAGHEPYMLFYESVKNLI
jgi:ubiquitin C-terminal hydrolase